MLGFTPRQVDEMTVWEFIACVEGYAEAHRAEDAAPPPMQDDDLAALGIKGF